MHKININTPLGLMTAIADNTALYVLDFADSPSLTRHIAHVTAQTSFILSIGSTHVTDLLQQEIAHYFEGNLTQFKTPLALQGTSFQQKVWQALLAIPYGTTCSYLTIAKAVGYPKACRAVARANATNRIPLIIPCHRVINHNGKLGGYNSGLGRKRWLLHHEKASTLLVNDKSSDANKFPLDVK